MATKSAPETPALLHVWRVPHPLFDLSASIGDDGADLPADEARALVDRGLVTLDKPEGEK